MTARFILGATTLGIAGLVMTLQPRPERLDTPTPRFDDPGAADRVELSAMVG